MSVCVVSPYWGQNMNITVEAFPLPCVSTSRTSSPFTYRLNHCVLDLPVAVLLHPGLLDDQSPLLLRCLSVERCWISMCIVDISWKPSSGSRQKRFPFERLLLLNSEEIGGDLTQTVNRKALSETRDLALT